MYIIANLLIALAKILDIALQLYMWIIIARAVLSWVNPDPGNQIVRFIYNVTEPALYRIRRTIPAYFSGIDFTPMILILIIIFLREFLVPSMLRLAIGISM